MLAEYKGAIFFRKHITVPLHSMENSVQYFKWPRHAWTLFVIESSMFTEQAFFKERQVCGTPWLMGMFVPWQYGHAVKIFKGKLSSHHFVIICYCPKRLWGFSKLYLAIATWPSHSVCVQRHMRVWKILSSRHLAPNFISMRFWISRLGH